MLLSLWSTYWRGPQPQGVTLTGVVTGEAAGPSVLVTQPGGGSQVLQLLAVNPLQTAPAPQATPGTVTLSFTSALPIGVQPSPALQAGPITLVLSGVLSGEAPGSFTATLLGGGTQTLQLIGVLTGERAPSPVRLSGTVTLGLSGTPRSGLIGHGPTVGTTVSVPTEYIGISVTVTVAPTEAVRSAAEASAAVNAALTAAAETLATWVAALTVSNTLLAQATLYSEGLQMADEIVRGNSVTIKATFRDALGAIVVPSSAAVFISFPSSSGQRTTVELPLVNVSNEWTATWDSSVARTGEVFWSAQTKNTTPSAAVDGSFVLTANMANPENLT